MLCYTAKAMILTSDKLPPETFPNCSPQRMNHRSKVDGPPDKRVKGIPGARLD